MSDFREDVFSRGESHNERAIVCPWCGYEDPASPEWQPERHGPEGDGEATCASCERDFECSRTILYRYSTRRPSMSERGYATEACAECECEPNSWHEPGCSEAPRVCPGCYAIDAEPCAGYCPDAALARDRERSELDDYEPDDLNDSDDWSWEPDPQEGA